MDGIAGIQARIDQIVGRFSGPGVAGGVLGAGESDDGANFAATLARAETAQGGSGDYEGPAGGTLNKAGVDPVQWGKDFLTQLGLPTTSENVRAMSAWQQAEGTGADFNPLATIQGGFAGATNFNSVGVKNYANYEDGLAANIKAITNGRYENILAALRRGNSAMDVADAIAASPWGSGELVRRILQG